MIEAARSMPGRGPGAQSDGKNGPSPGRVDERRRLGAPRKQRLPGGGSSRALWKSFTRRTRAGWDSGPSVLLEDCFQNNLQRKEKTGKPRNWKGSCKDLSGSMIKAAGRVRAHRSLTHKSPPTAHRKRSNNAPASPDVLPSVCVTREPRQASHFSTVEKTVQKEYYFATHKNYIKFRFQHS